MGGFQFAEKIADVLARVDFIVFAALDHRVHEGVVHRRALASDIAGIAEVHLEFPYALLADIVRHLDISAFKYTFHRWPFGPCISHGFFQQLTTSGIIRQSIVRKSILYRSHQVGSAARLEPGNISFSACHVLLLEAVFLCEDVTYGSIIVSLEAGSVIDLLGDRDVKSFQAWLDEHVQVEVVSRDRSTDYTAAIAATGRNITEMADRFHLNMNMSDCVTKVIGSHYDEYRSAVRPEEVQETPKVNSRQVMFKEVKELQAEGLNIAQISKKLDIARQTVRKYMGYDTLPKRASKERLPYYLYDTYVEEEYRHGKDLRKIFMEIKGKGFPGSLTPFYDHYSYLSDGHHGHRSGQEVKKMKQRPNCDREPLLPIRQIAHIVDKSIRKEKMAHAEVALVEKMMSYGWFRDIYNAASSFYTTIMGNDIDEPDSWLDSYGKSPIKELRSFAYGIRMDLKAVRNAITLDTSNGIVEGFVNKLKAVKRVMFGRASLDLLKRKMVFSDLCFN